MLEKGASRDEMQNLRDFLGRNSDAERYFVVREKRLLWRYRGSRKTEDLEL